MPESRFDDSQINWVPLLGPDNPPGFPVDYSIAVLGACGETGSLDLLVKFPVGGHCTYHRHIGKTTTFVLEGEHHVFELGAEGEWKHELRRAGHHTIGPGGHRHIEGGGEVGSVVLFSMQAVDGHIFDLLDPEGNVVQKVTLDELVAGASS